MKDLSPFTHEESERIKGFRKMSYYDMLYKQRYARSEDGYFHMSDQLYKAWIDIMNEKRDETGDNGVSTSKAIGWG
jgi:hypothetical protein